MIDVTLNVSTREKMAWANISLMPISVAEFMTNSQALPNVRAESWNERGY